MQGAMVSMVRLDERHIPGMLAAADPSCFTFHLDMPTPWDLAGFKNLARRVLSRPATVAYAMQLNTTGELVGVSTYMDIRAEHKGLEIGSTWISKPYRGTVINPESKLLMLANAFENFGAHRVQLKCDGRNIQSQAAIAKLGAQREGVLRKHMVALDGFVRDTVMFSIIQAEWPEVRAGLEARIARIKAKA